MNASSSAPAPAGARMAHRLPPPGCEDGEPLSFAQTCGTAESLAGHLQCHNDKGNVNNDQQVQLERETQCYDADTAGTHNQYPAKAESDSGCVPSSAGCTTFVCGMYWEEHAWRAVLNTRAALG